VKLGVLVYLENNDEHLLMIHREKKDEHQGLWLHPAEKSNQMKHHMKRRSVKRWKKQD